MATTTALDPQARHRQLLMAGVIRAGRVDLPRRGPVEDHVEPRGLDPQDRHQFMARVDVVDDEVTQAVAAGIARYESRAWDPQEHPRIPTGHKGGGRFRKLADRIFEALQQWEKGEGPDDPFADVLDADPVKRREQIRRVATKELGLTLRHGASYDEIAKAVLDDIRGGVKAKRQEKKDTLRLVPEGKPKGLDPTKLSGPPGPDRPQVLDRDGVRRDVMVIASKDGKRVVVSTVDSTSGERTEDVTRQPDFASLRQWAVDNDYPDLAKWVDKHVPADKMGGEKKTPAGKPSFDPAEVAAQVNDQPSESAVVKLLAGDPQLTSARLRKVADELGLDIPENVKAKTSLQMHIAEKVTARRRGLPGGGEAEKVVPDVEESAPSGRPDLVGQKLSGSQLIQLRPGDVVERPGLGGRERATVEQVTPGGTVHLDDGARITPWSAEVTVISQADREAPKAPAKTVAATMTVFDEEQQKFREIPRKEAIEGYQRYIKATLRPGEPAMGVAEEHLAELAKGGEAKNYVPYFPKPSVHKQTPAPAKVAKKAAPKPEGGLTADVDTLRQLGDPEAIRDELDLKKVPELKELAGHLGVAKSGRKRDLVDRLVDSIAPGGGTAKRRTPGTVTTALPGGSDIETIRDARETTAHRLALGDHLTSAGRRALDALGPAGHPRIAAIPDTEQKVREAYRMLAMPGGGVDHYVALSDLRKLVGDQVPRADMDDTLQRMSRMPDVRLTPQSYGRGNAVTRIPAALIIGGEEYDMLHVDDPSLARPSQFAAVDMARELVNRRTGGTRDPMMANLSDADLSAEVDQRIAGDRIVAADVAREVPDYATPPGTRATGTSLDDPYTRRRQRLRDALRGNPTRTEQLEGGISADSQVLVYADGTRVVRKDYGTDPVAGKVHADTEELAAQVFDAVGVQAPAVHRVDDHTVAMEFVAGRQGGRSGVLTAPAAVTNSRDGRLIGLADALVGHRDRNLGNWIRTPDGRIVPIDNGGAFLHSDRAAAGNPFTGYLMGRHDTSPWKRDINLPDGVDLAEVRRRLQALQPEFDRLGRGDWHRQMMGRLDEIERRAVPTPGTSTTERATTTLDRLAADLAQIPDADRRVGGVATPNELVAQWRRQLDSGELTPDALPELFERMTVRYSTAEGDPVGAAFAKAAGDLRTPDIDVEQTLAGFAGLTVRQKRARLRALGLPEDQIDQLVPTASKARKVTRSADDEPDGDVDDDEDFEDDEDGPDNEDFDEDEDDTEIFYPASEAARAADPEALHHYWTKGKGLAKWASSPHPWTALYRHLRKYVGSARAKRMAAQWHHEVLGIWPGEKKGRNPAGPG